MGEVGRPRKYPKHLSKQMHRKQIYDYMKTTYVYGGIYQIIAGDKIVYIGRSRRINDRMSNTDTTLKTQKNVMLKHKGKCMKICVLNMIQ